MERRRITGEKGPYPTGRAGWLVVPTAAFLASCVISLPRPVQEASHYEFSVAAPRDVVFDRLLRIGQARNLNVQVLEKSSGIVRFENAALSPAFLDTYGDTTSPEQRRVLRDLVRCRTAALGGHVEACDGCGHQRIAYNSCRNRHCPKCQAATRAAWLQERAAELLPVDYFHVVLTLPHQLGPLALQNQRVVYGSLFQAAAQTLLQVAADPQYLGTHIGFHMVLHTWGQHLLHHPHVHGVVPGGG